jgi:hypothetical protein
VTGGGVCCVVVELVVLDVVELVVLDVVELVVLDVVELVVLDVVELVVLVVVVVSLPVHAASAGRSSSTVRSSAMSRFISVLLKNKRRTIEWMYLS